MRRLSYAVLSLAAVLAVSLPAAPAFAAGSSYTWIGSSQNSGGDGHSWTDPKNWSPSGVPGTGDSVTIAAPEPSECTAHVDNIPTVSLVGLTLSETPSACSVSINGGGITVTGSFSWNGGGIATPITIASGASGSISGSNSRLNELTSNMSVAGSLTLSGVSGSGASNTGAMRIDNPNVLHVLSGGRLTSTGANNIEFLSCCGNPAKVVNDGTLAVSGADFLVDAVELDQNGTLTASSGGRLVTSSAPVTAGNGARYTGSGDWLIEDRATAKMSGTQNLGGNFQLELGPLDMNGGAQLGGTATIAGTGTVDWTGGTIEGNITIAHGVTVNVSGAHTDNGKRGLAGQDGLSNNIPAVLTNHGTMRLSKGAGILTAANAQLVNASDGVLSMAPGTAFTSIGCCVNPTRIINHGTVIVPSGSSSTPALISGVAYQSNATTSVAPKRALQLDEAPGKLSAATVKGGGTLAVTAPLTVSGTISVASDTTLALRANRGSLNGTATIAGHGSLHWTGGAVSGKITVATSGGTVISGTDEKDVAGVNGTSTPSTLTLDSKTTFAAGTKDKHNVLNVGQSRLVLASTTTAANYVDIYAGTVVNTGTFTIKPGSGTVTRSGSGPLTNRGTLKVASGTLFDSGDYTQAAGSTTIARGASLTLLYVTRSITVSGGVLEGDGAVAGGVTNSGGTVKPAASDTGTLHISGDYTQARKGRLAIDLATKSSDVLAVKGAVTLDGKVSAHDVGRYSPKARAKHLVLTGSSVTGSLSCVMTSGAGSKVRHWAGSHTSVHLYLTRRNGRHTGC